MPLSHIKPDLYKSLLDDKVQRVKQLFTAYKPPALQVFDSPPLHFRLRAEFKIWHEGDDTFYTMFDKSKSKLPLRVDDFPIGATSITLLMPALLQLIKQSTLLRLKLFQVEFLSTLSQQTLVTLIYHKRLDEDWLQAAAEIQNKLGIKIIGRSKKQKCILSDDYVIEKLTVNDSPYQYQQIEGGFTQPNATVNQKMLSWAQTHSRQLGGDLLELYCGNGNFTVVLADNFRQILATEISKTSVKSAHYNFAMNNVDNVVVARMSSEDISSAIAREREYKRLKNVDLDSYQFSTVFVDPPRAGLDVATEKLVAQFDNIIYISCNPITLEHNLETLCLSHDIIKMAMFDQFPYTDHIECGVILKRKSS